VDEMRLVSDLLRNEHSVVAVAAVRPVRAYNDAVHVQFSLALNDLMDIDENTNIATMQLWKKMQWNDVHLEWDEDEYGGIPSVRLPTNRIWKPDISLYRGKSEVLVYQLASVSSSGQVTQEVAVEVQVKCDKLDGDAWFGTTSFSCPLEYGSWTYDASKLNPELGFGSLDYYNVHAKYSLVEYTAVRNITTYDCCPEEYPVMTMTAVFQAR